MRIIGTMRRHPAVSYFLLAFAISWAGVLAAIGGGSIPAPPEVAQQRFVFVYLAMLLGPPVAGIAMTAIVGGSAGLTEYRRRLFTWRVDGRWYALAILGAPLAVLVTDLLLSFWSPDFLPAVFLSERDAGPVQAASPTGFVFMSVAVGFGAGFFEELGWTGFATPTLRTRYGIVQTAVLLGVMWGAWHFLAVYWGSASAFGTVPASVFMLVGMFSFLPPYRLLMVRVHERTGSLLIGILMHASLTSSMLIFGPHVVGAASIANNLAFSTVLWLVAAVPIARFSRTRPEPAVTLPA
jgi:uncharacterized protein